MGASLCPGFFIQRRMGMKGYLTNKQEFLFPDSPLGEPAEKLRLAAAANQRMGIQLLIQADEPITVSVQSDAVRADFYEMLDIPVEYNTGNGVDQGGAMVILPETCPDYAVRKAPFRVYDCMKPTPNGVIPAKNGVAAAYVTLEPRKDTAPGTYELPLTVCSGGETHVCQVTFAIYPVRYDEDAFQQTNWFSFRAIEEQHNVRRGTPEFYDLVRQYARSMRAVHQKVFLIWMHEDLSERKARRPYRFDFEDMKPIIEIFFEEGFTTFETGGLLCRGSLPDGSPDMFTNDLKCSANPAVSVDSDEGYELLCAEMRDFSAFLRRNGWEKNVLFHVMDEPDVHVRSEADLQARRVQFFIASNIVRRYLPGVRILEAVKSTQMRSGVDILCPITDGFERNKAAFDTAMALGDAVWTYVCCGPQGHWLNRFLDSPVNHGRLIFWGCAKYGINGYLHWGWNQFTGVPNPYEKTACRNNTGIGTDFPCGDAFIVYPGSNGPWISLRFEAERIGAEEACLLQRLGQKNPEAQKQLIGKVFTRFDEYNDDPGLLEEVHEELLEALCQ